MESPLTPRPHILFVDDELPLRAVVSKVLERRGVEVTAVGDALAAVEALREGARVAVAAGGGEDDAPEGGPFDLLLTDFHMPDMDGLELLAHAREHYPDMPAIMLTGHASVQHAVRAMASGAVDYLPKPFSVDALGDRVLDAIRASRDRGRPPAAAGAPARRAGAPASKRSTSSIAFVGDDPAIVALRDLAARVAPTLAPVFIHGESGTGKEVLARYLHAESGRPGPFVAVNCAALPRDLAESALFGHRRGAFTGANTDHAGVFEEAHGGTLLLDEVTEVDPSVQAKLLRALQEREVRPVGASKAKAVDVRVLATSNREVAGALADGHLREDLYHRLAVFEVALPPLRERPSDVRALAERFAARYAALYGLGTKRLSDDLVARLAAAPWPGNVRQLENVVHRAVVLSAGREEVTAADADHAALGDDPLGAGPGPGGLSPRPRSVVTLDEMERVMVLQALDEAGGNRTVAAEKLGVSDRTIRNKLKRYREEGYVDDV